ncbi:MAG: site-2 protease family protein [Anaerolineales bacterium]|jgi:Zn-dependent protease|nr:site-2 protease family protein [Anaerolineales bacterium]
MLGLDPATLISSLVVLFVAFPIHELAHAWTATMFGDDTPRLMGRLTLNPLAHLDVMGSLLLIFAGFGWAKPVPVNPYVLERRSPAALMLVSLAGPLSNLLLAILASIPFRLGLVSMSFSPTSGSGFLPTPDMVLTYFVYLNLLLMLFNLIPLAPLDGDKILAYFLPPNMAQTFDRIRPYGPMILLLLVVSGSFLGFNLLGEIIGPPMLLLLRLLVG